MYTRLFSLLALWSVTSKAAFAVFSEQVISAPEPSITALLAAGGLVAVGARYLIRRKRKK